MSHFCMLVIGENVDEQLAPYNKELEIELKEDENGEKYWHNPKGYWGWYTIGGRWANTLCLKTGEFTKSAKANEIDWDFPGKASIKKLSDKYKNFYNFVEKHNICNKSFVSWRQFKNIEDDKLTIEQKRSLYWNQNIFLAIQKHNADIVEDNVDEFIENSLELLISDINNDSIFYGFIKDGIWHEKAKMGWWAIDDATLESKKLYVQQEKELIDSIKDTDIRVTVVDCHIKHILKRKRHDNLQLYPYDLWNYYYNSGHIFYD